MEAQSMYDSFNRRINYLRISVTDRCNLRCRYCMPAEGVQLLSHDEILRFDEIMEVVDIAVSRGVDKIRITGGEPLVRKGVVELIAMIAKLEGVKDLGMTTNGLLLEQYAVALKEAGLMRVNISMDTTDPDRYREITRIGDISLLFRGIKAAVSAGLTPVKLNCVIKKTPEEPDAQLVKRFAEDNGLQVRFIHEMNLETGYFRPVIGGDGGDCKKCNRLRLTSNGIIKPCLFSSDGFSVRELGAAIALEKALRAKPKSGGVNSRDEFYNLGG
ncbi:MAG: radical SAM protein [Bacteroidales bacterium]|nr:radical SAM protein [Bacteroidales bacterium]MDD3385370.1 radical SAM protein [Bacteroidales bacterium]MDD3810877.1 radical SAM protein [Bacteroidales bacterium]MDD3870528.1 radical SAM protein [Bacteroidales bacterium]MDD4812649.1 radical SAM protein [Bacteroidales bacterium]